MIAPGKTIGILGGGRPARMLAQAAERLGYRVRFRAPGETVEDFARACDAVTCVADDVPLDTLQAAGSLARLRPHPGVHEICRDAARTAAWLRDNGFPGAEATGKEVARLTMLVVRGETAAVRVFPAVENIGARGAPEFSILPARVPAPVAAQAEKLARLIAEKIGLVGVMGVEMATDAAGAVGVTALVPHPPSCGSCTIDACMTSQFEQQVRAVCGLPLGSVELTVPAIAMAAVSGGGLKWDALLAQPSVRLHLDGAAGDANPEGFFTVTARDADMALEFARKYKARLR